jgi:integrase/recombinase XerC
MKEHTYHEQVNIDNAVKLRGLIASLPRFCGDYFRGIEPSTSSRTRIAYAYDLRTFFEFLHENNSFCKAMDVKNFPLTILDQIKAIT